MKQVQYIKCPRCENIMGGCSSKSHTGEKHCYYQCANCKTRVSEKKIEKQMINFLDDMLDFFLLVDNTYKPYLYQETENELKKCNKIIFINIQTINLHFYLLTTIFFTSKLALTVVPST